MSLESAVDDVKSSSALLGQMLLQQGVLGADQLRIALHEQRLRSHSALKGYAPLGQILLDLGLIGEEDLHRVLAKRVATEQIDLQVVQPDTQALRIISRKLATQLLVVPIAWQEESQTLTLATATPHNLPALDQLRSSLPAGGSLLLRLASEAAIRATIKRFYRQPIELESLLAAAERGDDAGKAVIQLVDTLFSEALTHGASDLHFEPEASFVRIRQRVDGMLNTLCCLHHSAWPALAVRLKVMANLDLAEQRAPQDGRISLQLAGHETDCRLSTQPTLYGENIVARLFDRHKGILPLGKLGLLDGKQLDLLTRLAEIPQGLLLVCGPTGCGKTTTLYALLQHIDDESINIMTLEDPVEYPLPRLRQTSLDEHPKLDFASGVRALLRQDPDVLLVGEIRDADTAGMAVRASITGHRVFSTLHSNNALGAIPRLLDLGVSGALLASALSALVAQRLLRRLCPHCRIPYTASSEELSLLHRQEPLTLYRAQGCLHCNSTGYKGRFSIVEILPVSPGLAAMIAGSAAQPELLNWLAESGIADLAAAGRASVCSGETSLQELQREIVLCEPSGSACR